VLFLSIDFYFFSKVADVGLFFKTKSLPPFYRIILNSAYIYDK